jgi:iron complex transport system substrate-binding protein
VTSRSPRAGARPGFLRGTRPFLLLGVVVALAVGACAGSSTRGSAVAKVSDATDAPATATPATPMTTPATGTPTTLPATPTPAPLPFPVTLTDDEGTAVTIPARPTRIVSLTPAVTETLFALGAGDRLIANGDFDDYPAQVGELPHVATYMGVDIEKIVGLTPDLVIAGGNDFNSPDAIAKLRAVGIPVVVVYADSVDAILADIRLVGTSVGAVPESEALTAWMRDRIDAIAAAAATSTPARVFYELDATNEIYGPAPKSFIASMVELAGGDPITTGDPAIFAIPLEKLIAADPQVIVLGDAAYGMTPAAVAGRPGWGGMTAVKAGAVRPVEDTIVTRPGPRIVEGLRALALAIDPTASLPEVGSPPPVAAP